MTGDLVELVLQQLCPKLGLVLVRDDQRFVLASHDGGRGATYIVVQKGCQIDLRESPWLVARVVGWKVSEAFRDTTFPGPVDRVHEPEEMLSAVERCFASVPG